MKIDCQINARWVVPVEPESVVYEHYSLVINHGKIIDLLATPEATKKYHAQQIENLPHHALIPGLVNAHTHAAMTLMRGIADDLPLMEWLNQHIWPLEQKWLSEEFVRDGTDLAIAEMLRSGTTCFNDMYFFADITAEQVIKNGIRACLGLLMLDFPTAWAANPDSYLEKGLALHQKILHYPLLRTLFAPHAPYTVSNQSLSKMCRYADLWGLPIHMHVHETAAEIQQQLAKSNQTPLQRLQMLGLLNANFIAVHMTQMNDEEIALFAQTGAHIVHCPESNLKLASGFCPVAKCLTAGINVALGTDSAASNNDLDMFGEMRTAALLAKVVANNAGAVSSFTALKMATLNGAKALGLADEIGSLKIGKAADLVAIDLDILETQPLYNPVSQIVYASSRQQVTDVWVAGKQLLKQRQLTQINLPKLKQNLSLWQQRLSQTQV